jgi:hypothetical protein
MGHQEKCVAVGEATDTATLGLERTRTEAPIPRNRKMLFCNGRWLVNPHER